ncbi:hypothetical protein BMR1_02g02060 [Babesia microti strain RI]|uniref:Uncharacterized protein n=1 Tax=Babesia microti (strain RI) TaxID=1133968 RepID=A0A1R4AAD3_BABMR|nr:hypothetical protein BMR1_02g02060 [Babesia microti strain RI]SJK85966.1 hypothetical protein BMR1_02g02060 [Babesia microti strain RI]|eukprot:XP_012648179.2 hypothetical protein BMR1_02g02060 [Babesia microti strain RI]
MIRKSLRSIVPKKHFDEQYSHTDPITTNKRRSINSNNNDSDGNRLKLEPNFDDGVIHIAGKDIFEFKCLLDKQSLVANVTHKGIPIIYHATQYRNQQFDTKQLKDMSLFTDVACVSHNSSYYDEMSCNSYIASLESLIEIDAINVIKRILVSSDDIWSLSPAKIADEIELNYRRPLSKVVKRMIECLAIGFTHEILLNMQINSISGVSGFIDGEIIKAQTAYTVKGSATDIAFDDVYDIEIESSHVDNNNYNSHHCSQISIKNKFKRHYCDMIIAWRVPINPVKYRNTTGDVDNIFTMLDPRELERVSRVNLSFQGKSKELILSKCYVKIINAINNIIDKSDLDDGIRDNLRYLALAITFQT